MKKNLLITLIVFIFIIFTNAQIITTQSDGLATILKNDLALAKEAAIIDAQRNAIQQTVGNFVDVEAITFNGDLLASSVYSKAQGFIKSYKIISEEQRNDIYMVSIEAKVQEGDLQDKIHKIIDRESILLLIENVETSAELKKDLSFAGYKVIDGKGEKNKDFLNKITRGQLKPIRELGLKYLSSILLTGKISSISKQEKKAESDLALDKPKTIYSLSAAFTALNTKTGEVITAENFSAEGFGFSDEQAKNNALKQLGQTASAYFVEKLDKYFGVSERPVSVIIYGLESFEKFKQFKFLLSNMRWVRGISNDKYDPVESFISLKFAYDIKFLSEPLSNYPELKINKVNHNELILESIHYKGDSIVKPEELNPFKNGNTESGNVEFILFIAALLLVLISAVIFYRLRRK